MLLRHLINLLITTESLLFLTSGSHRQQFFYIFSQLTSTQEEFQKIAEAVIIVLSVLIVGCVWSGVFLVRMAGVVLYTLYVLVEYNFVRFCQVGDLVLFAREVFVIGCALVWNIDDYIYSQQPTRSHTRTHPNPNHPNPKQPQPQQPHTQPHTESHHQQSTTTTKKHKKH